MKAPQLARLRALLSEERILVLGVVVDGEPLTGLLPYAVDSQGPALLVHVSSLARHAEGLREGGRFAALIRRPDDPAADPLQLERANLQGEVMPLPRGGAGYEAARAIYLRRFPGAAMTFGLGDFTLIRLRPDRGRLVTGFGGAINLDARSFADLGAALMARPDAAGADDGDALS